MSEIWGCDTGSQLASSRRSLRQSHKRSDRCPVCNSRSGSSVARLVCCSALGLPVELTGLWGGTALACLCSSRLCFRACFVCVFAAACGITLAARFGSVARATHVLFVCRCIALLLVARSGTCICSIWCLTGKNVFSQEMCQVFSSQRMQDV